MKSFKLETDVSPRQYFLTGLFSIIPMVIFSGGIIGWVFTLVAIGSFGMSSWIYGKDNRNWILQTLGFFMLGSFILILGITIIAFFQGMMS